MTDEDTQLSRVNPTALQPRNVADAWSIAQRIAAINFEGHKTPESALVAIMAGSELGFSAIQSLRAFHVIKNKAVLSSDAIVALASQSPECEYIECVETTSDKAVYAAKKKGRPEQRLEFTIEDAKRAGLGGDNWRKWPAAMLRARAGAAIARMVFPAAVHGLYIKDEIATHSEPVRLTEDGEVIEAEVVDADFEKASAVAEAIRESVQSEPSQKPFADRARARIFALMNETGLDKEVIEKARKAIQAQQYGLTSLTEMSDDQLADMGQRLSKYEPEERAAMLQAWADKED